MKYVQPRYGSGKDLPGTYVRLDSDSSRSTGVARVGNYQGEVTVGTKDKSDDEVAWSLGHEIAHTKLGHGNRMGMRSDEVIEEEEAAWRLAKDWNPDVPDDLIEKSVDTYRKIRGRRVVEARLREHVRVLESEDSSLVITYLEDILADVQTPDRVKEVASAMLRRRGGD